VLWERDSRTSAAVHEEGTLLEELSGHTARTLAIVLIVYTVIGIAYSANSLMFSMATDCDYGNVG
jgi:type IV secretory pathway VirB2 component (pilin)